MRRRAWIGVPTNERPGGLVRLSDQQKRMRWGGKDGESRRGARGTENLGFIMKSEEDDEKGKKGGERTSSRTDPSRH